MSACYCDYTSPEFYCREMPVARKEHRCYECGSIIRQGEKYERVCAKWDGEVGTTKTCPDCIAIRSALMDMDCFCWSHGGLLYDVELQFQEADFQPGKRFEYLRVLAVHRQRQRR
jgi:hypothetical protein